MIDWRADITVWCMAIIWYVIAISLIAFGLRFVFSSPHWLVKGLGSLMTIGGSTMGAAAVYVYEMAKHMAHM